MLEDPRVGKMAEVIAGYAVKVRPGMRVGIIGTTLALPLIEALYKQILALGGHPIPLVQAPGLRDILVAHGDPEQLEFTSPVTLMAYEQFEGLVSIQSEQNTRGMSNADAAKAAAYHSIVEWNPTRVISRSLFLPSVKLADVVEQPDISSTKKPEGVHLHA